MKVLDEGVDIPDTRMAIMMASSGNPRQYIQRRGRILRKALDKERAVIHDLIVVPGLSVHMPKEYEELEKRILRKELLRYREFAMSSENPDYALNLIAPIQRQYSIVWK
jgi:superfamily II DNA or RNA helicase